MGAELLLFITNSPKIVAFLKSTFEDTDTLKDLCEGLELWQKITPFLVITTIKNIDEYNELKKKFVSNLKKFYTIGGISFLTKKSISSNRNIGNDETFYMHTLRFFLPRIADKILEKHNLGLGIFTMQGFERRNKESKNTLRRFSNGIVNIVIGNLKRLWDIFFTGKANI